MTLIRKSSIAIPSIGLLMIGTAATAFAATSAATGSEPSVLVFDQKLSNGQISLDYVNMPTNGYAVIYGTDKNGKRSAEPLGHVELKAGDHRGVKVQLSDAPSSGSSLWASLYKDKDAKPGFAKNGDAPIWGEAIPAENRFTVQ